MRSVIVEAIVRTSGVEPRSAVSPGIFATSCLSVPKSSFDLASTRVRSQPMRLGPSLNVVASVFKAAIREPASPTTH